jgi:hypothetical protein
MSKSPPPIPSEQQSFQGATGVGRRDAKTGLQSNEPGDMDTNLKEQGRQGNIHQNVDKGLHARSGDR